MDKSVLEYCKVIGEVQACIANVDTLDEALQAGLRIIVGNCNAESAVIWYVDEQSATLRPYYWIGPLDLTSRCHVAGRVSWVGCSKPRTPSVCWPSTPMTTLLP